MRTGRFFTSPWALHVTIVTLRSRTEIEQTFSTCQFGKYVSVDMNKKGRRAPGKEPSGNIILESSSFLKVGQVEIAGQNKIQY